MTVFLDFFLLFILQTNVAYLSSERSIRGKTWTQRDVSAI